MDPEFFPAMAVILQNDPDALALVLKDTDLARTRSGCGHPTLLQFVVCEAKNLQDPVAAAKVLLDAGAPVQEPLVAAASVDARDMVHLLLAHGGRADITDAWGPLDEALYWRHQELAAVLRAAGAGVHSLRVAAALGDLETLEGLMRDGSQFRFVDPGARLVLTPSRRTAKTNAAKAAAKSTDKTEAQP